MSLIVDALKRAQEGTRRLPPLGGPVTRGFPGLASPRRGGLRSVRTLALLIGAALVLAGGWYARTELAKRRPADSASMPRMLVVEPLADPPPAAPATPDATETAAAAPAETDPPSEPPDQPRPARRPQPRPQRLAAEPAGVVPAPAPASRPAAVTPTVQVEVHRVTTAEAALAAGRDSQARGDHAAAVEQYMRGIEADPTNPALFNNYGVALRRTGQTEAAARAFQQALDLDPKYEKALNNLGVTRREQGRFEDALDLFKQAISVNAANAESHVNLGVIYLQAGRTDEALGALQDAVRHDPRLAVAHYNLGLLWQRRGNHERSRQHLEVFLTLASPDQAADAARVRDYLRQLDGSR